MHHLKTTEGAMMAVLLGDKGAMHHQQDRLDVGALKSALRQRSGDVATSIEDQERAYVFFRKHGGRACRRWARAILRSL